MTGLQVFNPEQKEAVIRLVLGMGYNWCRKTNVEEAVGMFKNSAFFITSSGYSLAGDGSGGLQELSPIGGDGVIPVGFFSYLNSKRP